MHQAGSRRRTPGGLLLPVRAALKGRIRWQVLDERGVPEVPRSPSGLPLGPVEGIEQSNLITDLGMDQIAQYDCLSNSTTTTGSPWRRYMAVGTGSSAPANGDTTLDAEVQRAASSGSFSAGSNSYELDDATDVWRASSLVTRLVTMNADRNITEFGFSPAASGAIGIRELFRDSGGNPITVSLLNGKSLRIDHTLIIELDAPSAGHPMSLNIESYDAGNNLIGTVQYDYTFGFSPRQDNGSLIEQGFNTWNPYNAVTTGVRRLTSRPPYSRIGTMTTDDLTSPSAVVGGSLGTFSSVAYVNGSHARTRRATVSTGDGNSAWSGFVIMQVTPTPSYPNGRQTGWFALFDNPATYTKASTDTLRFGFVSTWARA